MVHFGRDPGNAPLADQFCRDETGSDMNTERNDHAGRIRFVSHSMAALPPGSAPVRKPRFGWKKRGSGFLAGFERHVLFYDVFRHMDGKTVLLVGPPPRNLFSMLKGARFSVDKKSDLAVRFHVSQSVMIVEVTGAPADADELRVEAGGQEFRLAIQPNHSTSLAGARVIFTISKNNPLSWIRGWADYHHRFHGADTLVLVDNGSTNASLAEIAAELEKTGIENIFLLSMPYIFGAIDDAVLFNPFWTNFLQNCINSIVLRRFAGRARGLLNCDIDELARARNAPDIFAMLDMAPKGLVVMNGAWIEAHPFRSDFGDHRNFGFRLQDAEQRVCREKKWVLDPGQDWVQNLGVHPYWHWIEGRPRGAKHMTDDAFFWHFKGINSNWKVHRNVVSDRLPEDVEPDEEFLTLVKDWSRD